MKILFFIHSLSSGGAERVLSLLANDWDNNDHEISIALNTDQDIFHPINTSIEIITTAVESHGLLTNIKRVNNYKKAILKQNPDVVISFMTSTNIRSIIAAKLTNKPVIVAERNTYNDEKSRFWRLLRRITYPFSDLLIVQTTYEKKQYPFVKKVEKIENPLVTYQRYQDIHREKIIIAVGRLHPNKGFDLLIEAYSKLTNPQNWKLLILGEGNERTTLEDLIKSLNLEKEISLLGRIKDVEQYYKKASIFVLSSRIEGFPNVLCEAMAYGCPPIAFDCLTGPNEIIEHNKSGILVAAENTAQLSQEMQNLIDSPQKRQQLANNAKKISDRLNLEKISNNWLKHINTVVDKK